MRKFFLLLLLYLVQQVHAQEISVVSVKQLPKSSIGKSYHPKFSPNGEYLLLTSDNYSGLKKFDLKTPGREDDDEETKLYTKADVNARRTEAKEGESGSQAENSKDSRSAAIAMGMGGRNNITSVDCCATRLRCSIADSSLVDEKLLKYNLVLCGSSQNMMYGLFLDSTAPLYGRADEIMKLAPIRLPYIQEALSLDAMNAIEEYAVWGGVPRYWELRENQNSLNDALWHNILSVNGTLYEEPIKLFQDDVKDIVKTSTIMSYIGTGANRLSEIAARCNEPATNLSRPLKKLIDLGFLEKDVPFGIDEKNAKKSLYKIADPFMAFYYQFVVPNRSFIELGRRLPIEQALTAHLSEYVSMQWEKLCRDAVTGNLVNGVVYGKAKRWWGSVLNEDKKPEQVEFDVMAESLDKKYLLVGECKWTTQENGKQLTAELLRKANLLPFAKCYTVVPMLFLKNAPKDGIRNAVLPENIVELMK